MPVEQFGKPIKIAAYRYPVPEGTVRKGVVFYIHGYGCYAHHDCMMVDLRVKHGHYDVFAIDHRGCGKSGGQEALIESVEDMYNDQWLLIHEAIKTYKIDQQKVPLFLYGRSMGGMIATNMMNTSLGSKMFRALFALTPFFRLANAKLYDKMPMIKFISYFKPFHVIPTEKASRTEEYMARWGEYLDKKQARVCYP